MNRITRNINNTATNQWKNDCMASVDYYNAWFINFAPPSFRVAREESIRKVKTAFQFTKNALLLDADTLLVHPEVLAVARQMTCPPLARDRLSGLSGVPSSFLKRCEESDGHSLPEKYRGMLQATLDVISKMLDKDILTWLSPNSRSPSALSRNRAAIVIADRLCGALADPILRNAQEKRQLKALSDWLSKHGYTQTTLLSHRDLKPGQYAIHVNMPCRLTEHSANTVNVSVDMIILPKSATHEELPILIEAKSAGDFTNVNKRRKEEARKMEQLRKQYGEDVRYLLFLCGYFDAQYLGYEASEGIDWIWEHRISDMEGLGL
ncbi:MAG: XamI family restriction endonuclease [Kiritimatiellae bacterium]|nr:XamI family restriction endonuclease [Kiritimatiellia bacterium]